MKYTRYKGRDIELYNRSAKTELISFEEPYSLHAKDITIPEGTEYIVLVEFTDKKGGEAIYVPVRPWHPPLIYDKDSVNKINAVKENADLFAELSPTNTSVLKVNDEKYHGNLYHNNIEGLASFYKVDK